ncbi:MAG: molecular chaperone HtpG [Candidatus Eremiobacterota bacterium]
MEKMEFKTEVKQLLDLMIHSLYTNKEIFLRELLSNASDAIDKARYESLTNSDILEGQEEWKIKIITDKEAKTITIRDNGIGMTKEDIIRELGTIAHSGTKEFLKALKEKEVRDNPELIGQFGVGFYSSFMVADKVTVISRTGGTKGGTKWESGADETFTVEEVEKEHRGTDVIVHLKEDETKYLESWEIRNIIRKYSDYIEHPIVMDVEKTGENDTKTIEEETLNSQKAIWLKSKSDITDSEYNEFYKHLSRDISDPAKVIHYKAEGTSEFTALLYIPGKKPFDIFYRDFKYGPTLYVKRVQIMSNCEELLPVYLRFVKGVVDSSDLPLNISREILQNNRQVEIIKNNLTKKVIDTLSEMKKDEYEKYLEFYKEFGKILKEGIHYDFSKREVLADLLLLQSTKTDGSSFTTFEKYVQNMKEGQEEIYYITGMSREEVINSPYLEAFKEKDYEVLIMLEEVDDIIMSSLYDYKGKKVKSVIKGDIKLDKTEETQKETEKKKYEKLIDFIKEELKNDVKDVRLSGRLKDSLCCLVADEGDMDPQMEKILQAMGQSVPGARRILEINPVHRVVESMNKIFEKDSSSAVLKEYTLLLYDQALLLEGSRPKDPVLFTKAVTKLMAENVK